MITNNNNNIAGALHLNPRVRSTVGKTSKKIKILYFTLLYLGCVDVCSEVERVDFDGFDGGV